MRTRTSRLLHLMLAFALVLGMSGGIPALALAADGSAETTPAVSTETTGSASQEATPAVVQPKVGNVCKIGATEYATLGDALAAVADGDTITLLDNIDYGSEIDIGGITVTFDMNGFDLNVDTGVSTYSGLNVYGGGEVKMTGVGDFNVAGGRAGVSTDGGKATVTSATAYGAGFGRASAVAAQGSGDVIVVTGDATNNNDLGFGVIAASGSTVTVGGNVSSIELGIKAQDASTVTVGGAVTSEGAGVLAQSGSEVTVNGDVTAADGYGVYARGGAQVKVAGNLSSTNGGDTAINAEDDGTVVLVGGSVTTDGDVHVSNGASSVEIDGNVTMNGGGSCVSVSYGATLHIKGNVASTALDTDDYFAAFCVGGDGDAVLLIDGSLTSNKNALIVADSATATIGGNVNAGLIGVYAEDGGEATINGKITAPTYIVIQDVEYTAADFTLPTTKDGYKTYTDGVSTVWVKIPVVDQPPLVLPTTPTPKEGLPAAGDSSNLNLALAAGAAALAAAAGSCFVLVLRKRRS